MNAQQRIDKGLARGKTLFQVAQHYAVMANTSRSYAPFSESRYGAAGSQASSILSTARRNAQ